ncbi:MAG: efflux RND transporter permease subunit [Ignavibacteriales bacterium]|nr:efflux RND transporter permease subunit [Ignavibacteriales bacterium]
MKIWNIAVDNKTAVYLLMVMILIFGYTSYIAMPREATPDITIPIVIVSTPYIGVSPVDMEGLISQPLERALKGLKDVKEIRSVSKEGLSTIVIEFNTGIDIDEALRRVRDKVNSSRSQLPADILDPIVSEINLSEFPIMYVNTVGDVGLARLKKIAEELQDKIESVPGVLRADIAGGLQPEIQVNVDVYRMNAYQVSFDDVSGAIRAENLSIPGGTIETKEKNLTVRVPGEFKQVKPLEDIVLKIQNGKPIYLRDVATVNYSFEDRATYARLNENEVVSLAVRKRAGENLVRIADEVKEIIAAEQANLPAGISLEVSNDQSRFIKRMVHELENSIFTGMFLVVLSLFMFFGFKNSLLISTAIPLSMFTGYIVLGAMGITLNMVVLFALVLVLGILVDDAIVVIENTYRHQQEYGEEPNVAAKKAAGEVFIPVLTSTVTILSAFIPLLFWPGIVGEFMKFLPITLIVTLTASLFVAYVISPVQAAEWINYRKEIKKAKYNLEHPHWYKKYNPLTFLYHEVDEHFFPWMQKNYVLVLRWTLRNKWKTMGAAFALLLTIIVLFGMFNKGVEFFPTTEPAQISVSIECPAGASLEVTNNISKILEERLRSIPGRKDIEFIVSSIGTSENVFDFGGAGTSNKGIISINFYEQDLRTQSTFITMEEVRKMTLGIAGADLRLNKQQMGPPVGAPVSIEVSGEDYGTLATISKQIREKIKDVPGLVDLKDDYNTGRPEVEIIVDREKAGLFWTSTGQIASTVRAAIAGVEASKYRVGEDEYKIRVRLKEDQRTAPADLENLRINFMNRRGQLLSIPLTSVADIRRTTSVTDIRRKDMKRVITVSGDVSNRVQSEVLNDVKALIAGIELPNGYAVKLTGSQKDQQEASDFLSKAFITTLLLVFLIMVMEFNSMKVPFVIMLSVILSLIGVLFGLLVTRTPLSVMMTGVGIVALAGIVVRNGIILLDFVKHKHAEGGLSLDDALVEAGRVRLRPVILTAAAAVLALIPMGTGYDFNWTGFHFVTGSESAGFWRPLAVAIIFGLTISTFLTLVIVPTAYSLIDEWTEKIKGWIKWKLFKKDEV